ncbi:U32 family peptidase, partial [Candidatus Woesearchaeota archaeon]|nr:U32 family peptidase [Candidatus Woesearchaeota archaeon]
MNKIELLLPAGNWDLLKAAINNGADAVYLGVKEFNARRRADNFELDELDKVVLYAHERGVKVYCTLNILIKNSEITKFFETLKQIYLAGTDAIIIQDIALLNIIKETFPEMEVHISTQAGINNTNFLELVKNADRIILPRELSSDEIKKLSGKKDAEIFIHGAQCFSYSGKCLFSSCLGGRSGNRGLCAQPCRKKYNGEYLLSMKDLCLAKKIPEIIEMGIVSLKIEGRVRSINYVEAAAKFYRSAIDSYYKRDFKLNNELFKELELAFNRGFTQGYYSKEKEIISSDSGKSRGLFLGTIREDGQIKLEEDIEIDDGIGIWLKNRIDGAIIKRIENRRTQVDFAKKGETVNIFIRANPETNIYKTSTLKRPKRINFEKNKPIENEKRKLEDIKSKIFEIKETNNTISKKELLVRVHSKTDGLEAIKTGADHVFYNIFEHDFEEKFGAYIPIILNDEEIKQAIELIEKHQIKDILVGNLGAYAALKSNKELNLYLDYSNNVFNDLDLEYYKKYENTT